MIPKVKSVCLSGGGVTGMAHVGVLSFLEKRGVLASVETYVGTSIGAVVASLFVIGCTSAEIMDLLTKIDATTAFSFSSCAQFFNCYGVDSGEFFMAHLVDQFIRKHVSPTITFNEIAVKFNKRLIMVGTNLLTHAAVYFSPESHGDMRILDAVRISISIPFVLSAVPYQGALHVDGGVTDNFAFQYCVEDSGGACLASCICSMPPRPIRNIEDFIYNLFAASLNSKRDNVARDKRIIVIPTDTFDSFSFTATEEQKQALFQTGVRAAEKYIRNLETVCHPKIKRRHSI